MPVVNIAPSATRDVPIRPLIKLKPIKGNALLTDWDFRDVRSDLRIETISVHAKVIWRVPQSQKAWSNIGKGLPHSGQATNLGVGSMGIQHPVTLAGSMLGRILEAACGFLQPEGSHLVAFRVSAGDSMRENEGRRFARDIRAHVSSRSGP